MRALCWHGKGDVRVDTVPIQRFNTREMLSSKSQHLVGVEFWIGNRIDADVAFAVPA